MISRERRSHSLPKVKPYRRRSVRRDSRSRQSRFETTAQTGMFTVTRRTPRTRELFKQWPKPQPKPQRRRSKARLGSTMRAERYDATTAWVRKVVRAPGTVARLNGRLYLNVLILGLLVWLAVWFFVSERFYVNQIEVSGNQRVSSETIARTSALQGYSIFWVNPRQVTDRVLKAIPPIQDVAVRFKLPNAVSITVSEENSQLMWEIAGKRYWVDNDGTLQPVEEGCEASLIVRDHRLRPPEHVEIDALTAAEHLTRLLPEVSVVEYSPAMGLYYKHARGWDVYLGTGSDMAAKVGVLRAMEVQYAGQETKDLRINLRYRNGIYVRSSSVTEDED